MKRKKRPTEVPGISLPREAFRIPMLTGSMEAMPLEAGNNNIPLDSRVTDPLQLECLYGVPRIDYFSFTAIVPNIRQFVHTIEQGMKLIFDREEIIEVETDYNRAQRIKGSRGATITFGREISGGYRVRFSCGGVGCNGIPLQDLCLEMQRLSRLNEFRATRIDYNTDAKHGQLPLDQIADCLRTGDYMGYRRGEIIESVGGARAGITVYFGGKKSLQRVRFYDKSAESGVEGSGIRHEVQCRGEVAQQMLELIAGKSYGDICERIIGKLCGSISFGKRRGKNLDRFVVADYWKDWLKDLSSTPIGRAPLSKNPTISKTISWLGRATAKSFAIVSRLCEVIPLAEVVAVLAEKGEQYITGKDEGNIEDWLSQNDVSGFLRMLVPKWYPNSIPL
jgi:Replication initiation factor